MRTSYARRGSALITVVVIIAVIMLMILGLLQYAGAERQRAIANAHRVDRLGCAATGLQLARGYYGRNVALWNSTFLAQANRSVYNPLDPVAPAAADDGALTALETSHPELFADLDGDGKFDVYMYVRDNADELPPATDNPYQDNDQNVIVGAMCISSTLQPHRLDGTVDSDALTAEGLLEYNLTGSTYASQAGAGASGNGNMN
jgi:hypothetical protein